MSNWTSSLNTMHTEKRVFFSSSGRLAPMEPDQKFNVIGCGDAAGVQTFDSAGASFLGVVNN